MDTAAVLVITSGFLAGLILRSKGVSVMDMLQGMLVYIPALIVSLYVAILFGLSGTLSLSGWIGGILTAIGPIGNVIVGPIIVGLFYGLCLLLTALLSYLAMWRIEP